METASTSVVKSFSHMRQNIDIDIITYQSALEKSSASSLYGVVYCLCTIAMCYLYQASKQATSQWQVSIGLSKHAAIGSSIAFLWSAALHRILRLIHHWVEPAIVNSLVFLITHPIQPPIQSTKRTTAIRIETKRNKTNNVQSLSW